MLFKCRMICLSPAEFPLRKRSQLSARCLHFNRYLKPAGLNNFPRAVVLFSCTNIGVVVRQVHLKPDQLRRTPEKIAFHVNLQCFCILVKICVASIQAVARDIVLIAF